MRRCRNIDTTVAGGSERPNGTNVSIQPCARRGVRPASFRADYPRGRDRSLRHGADALRTSIAKACKAAGVPLWSPHDLRHRRISLLHLRGVPWARIRRAGRAARNLAVTANTYSHVLVDEAELDYAGLL
jgi:integrase